jgi:hypothetical protein
MGELIDAMGEDLTDLPTAPSTTLSPFSNVELLVMATGSGRAAARALGVAESTLRGWRNGARPRRADQDIVAATRAHAKPGRYRAAYQGDTSLAIDAVITVSGDTRKRTIHPGRNIPQRSIQAMLRAWKAGDDDRAEVMLLKAIDNYYQPMRYDRINRVYFE